MFYLKEICILELLHQSSSAVKSERIYISWFKIPSVIIQQKIAENCWFERSNHSHILWYLQSRHSLPLRWDSQTFYLLGMFWRSILFGQWTEEKDGKKREFFFGKDKSYRRPIWGPEKLLVSFLIPKEESARKSTAKKKGEENDKPRVAHNQQSPPKPSNVKFTVFCLYL